MSEPKTIDDALSAAWRRAEANGLHLLPHDLVVWGVGLYEKDADGNPVRVAPLALAEETDADR